MNELITVVIPAYNAESTIYEAIESICSQSYKNLEIIVVDDGSTDGTLNIIKGFKDKRILILTQKNLGVSKALNNAISIANGSMIVRMDSDDISHPDRIMQQASFMKKNKDVVLLGCSINYIDKNGQYLARGFSLVNHKEIAKVIDVSNPFNHPTVIFKKEIFLKTTKYDENLSGLFEDHYLWKEMLALGKVANLHFPLVNYRLTDNQITSKIETEKYKEIKSRVIRGLHYSPMDIKLLRDEMANGTFRGNRVIKIQQSFLYRLYKILVFVGLSEQISSHIVSKIKSTVIKFRIIN